MLINREIEKYFFKRKHVCWFVSRNLMDYVELFESAFAADAMLSRSIVACLDFDPLLPVLLKACVPVEVMAATLVHHVNSKGYYHESSLQVCMFGYMNMNTFFCNLRSP